MVALGAASTSSIVFAPIPVVAATPKCTGTPPTRYAGQPIGYERACTTLRHSAPERLLHRRARLRSQRTGELRGQRGYCGSGTDDGGGCSIDVDLPGSR